MHKMRYFSKILAILLIAFALLINFAIPKVYSQEIKQLECGTLVFPPFIMKDENDELKGIEVEVLNEIGSRLGINIKLMVFPWARLLKTVENGGLDCMFPAFKTPERQVYMDYINVPFHVSTLVFYAHKDNLIQYNSLNDLKDLTIGIERGFKTSPQFDKLANDHFFKIYEADNFDKLFQLLRIKRIDLVVVNHHVGRAILKNNKFVNIVALPKPLTANSAFLTFSKKKKLTSLVPLFDAVLFEILTDGTYEKISKKYIMK